MPQKFPEVGLRAVFEITGFNRNYNRYQSVMRDIDRTTKQTAQRVTNSSKGMSEGMASSFDELVRGSAALGDAMNSLPIDQQLQATQQWEQAFQALGQGTQVNIGLFDHLATSGVTLSDALSAAAGQVDLNVNAFDRLINRGMDADEAFRHTARSASSASSEVSILGRSFSVTSIAVAGTTAALRAGYQIVRESVDAYSELAEATRRVSLQTGLLTQEASAWVQIAGAAGISTTSAERAMSMFLSRVADMRREQVAGEESTSDFAMAISTLGISITNAQGTLRSTEDLLGDVNRAFQDLGPGIVSSQLATDLFGQSGRRLLPVLVDQERSMADIEAQAQVLGATLTSLDRENYEKLRQSSTRLQQAWAGLKNEIARGWVPAITAVKNGLADLLNTFRLLDAMVRAFEATNQAVKDGLVRKAGVWRYYAEQVAYFGGVETEAGRKAEEAAQARSNAAQQTATDVVAAEQKIQAEREKTLQQLDELKTELAQKLDDIDQDAKQKWDDILVNRQREAADRALQQVFRMEDLRQAYNEKLDDIEDDFARRWDDILVKRQREALERALRLAWRYEDLARSTEERRLDVIRRFQDREAEVREDVQQRIRDMEEDARQKREDLERDHQRKLRNIQQKYLDTATEAARRNDAVAVAQAMRQRDRELRDERQAYVDEQRDFSESLRRKREEIEQDRREREAAHRKELEAELQRIDDNYREQLEELARQQRREQILRAQQQQWELDDFNQAKAERLDAAQEWYDKQLAELEKAQKREAILRKIQYERQEIDFVRSWQRRIADARQWYATERNELAAHLDMTGQQLEAAYTTWMQQAASAAAQVSAWIATAMASEIGRYRQYLPGGQLPAAPPAISMAEGGIIQASTPTTVVMGDAGPETGVFLPGGSSSMNVNHSFGRMGVDVQGLPGGMNTQQVQAIFSAMMVQFAKNIQVGR